MNLGWIYPRYVGPRLIIPGGILDGGYVRLATPVDCRPPTGWRAKLIIATHSSPPGLSMATRKWGSNYFKGSGSGVAITSNGHHSLY